MPFDPSALRASFQRLAPAADYCALRVVDEHALVTTVRQDVAQPPEASDDRGAMVTIIEGDGIGYAATPDLSDAGLAEALRRAADLARLARGRSVFHGRAPAMPRPNARYVSPTRRALDLSKAQRIELLMRESTACRIDSRVVDWQASLWTVRSQQLMLTADGGEAWQEFDFTIPSLHVVAAAQGLTQVRSWGGRYNGHCRQGGMEVIEESGFVGSGRGVAEQALELLAAPNCPTGRMDVLLMPDQMMLQIHESIGHPIELDRILGDERNFAGTSFVTLDMFGSYRYGSDLLNVTYDPGREREFANFAVDDDGAAARREHVIRDGILQRPLGGTMSVQRAQALRSDIAGVATSRASTWNRPPIDRMSNLNVEPGDAPLARLVESIDDGVMMSTNASWSIDDSRNKFQFGCEWGRRIRGGKLAEVVRNPNYRGVSATFWRSLAMVGDESTYAVMGTPFCGKGEPNQVIRVGHASPACKFSAVDVFGAER
ncbi:MAG TPA: TldD/PmbA family protein [Burkholderiaceae bacterium]|nr:TldD/PmbA family protein [Burkholderiaceae bacterium]